jgi:hypothetical protein
VTYFIWKPQNKTDAKFAADADANEGSETMMDPKIRCGGVGKYQLLTDIETAKRVRNNIYSIYSRASTAFVLLLMIFLACLSTIYIPYYLKEFSIPAILRMTNDNMFFSTMRIRTLTFFSFMICGGCLPQLNFYIVEDMCLRTTNPKVFGLLWTDKYYYSLVTMLWFVAVPLLLY